MLVNAERVLDFFAEGKVRSARFSKRVTKHILSARFAVEAKDFIVNLVAAAKATTAELRIPGEHIAFKSILSGSFQPVAAAAPPAAALTEAEAKMKFLEEQIAFLKAQMVMIQQNNQQPAANAAASAAPVAATEETSPDGDTPDAGDHDETPGGPADPGTPCLSPSTSQSQPAPAASISLPAASVPSGPPGPPVVGVAGPPVLGAVAGPPPFVLQSVGPPPAIMAGPPSASFAAPSPPPSSLPILPSPSSSAQSSPAASPRLAGGFSSAAFKDELKNRADRKGSFSSSQPPVVQSAPAKEVHHERRATCPSPAELISAGSRLRKPSNKNDFPSKPPLHPSAPSAVSFNQSQNNLSSSAPVSSSSLSVAISSSSSNADQQHADALQPGLVLPSGKRVFTRHIGGDKPLDFQTEIQLSAKIKLRGTNQPRSPGGTPLREENRAGDAFRSALFSKFKNVSAAADEDSFSSDHVPAIKSQRSMSLSVLSQRPSRESLGRRLHEEIRRSHNEVAEDEWIDALKDSQ